MMNDNQGSFQDKLALIIGNGDYTKSSNKVAQSIENATKLEAVLKKIHFDVTMKVNLNRKDLLNAMKAFQKEIKKSSLVVFYFSGQGCQTNGINYLIPTNDNELETEKDLEERAVNIQRNLAPLLERSIHEPTQKKAGQTDGKNSEESAFYIS